MIITKENISEVFHKALIEEFGFTKRDVIQPTDTFGDLGLDELDVIELVMILEEEFDFDIPDIKLFQSVSDELLEITPAKLIDIFYAANFDFAENKPVEETRDQKIIRLHESGLSQNEISRQTGIPRSTVGDVVRRHKGIQKKHEKAVASVLVKETPTEYVEIEIVVEPPKKEVVSSWNCGHSFINCYVDGEAYTADSSHPKFEEARNVLIYENDVEKAVGLISVKRAIENYVNGDIKIEGNILTYKDVVLDTNMTRRIIESWKAGQDVSTLVEFLKNLVRNPRREAVYELFDFLKHNDIKITEDGHFLAYKRVTNDYLDIYTKSVDNSIGSVPEMLPFEVDPDRNNECSSGYHVAAKSYIPNYSHCPHDRVILCKVNPEHVVAIPHGYDHAKLRTWKYEVIEDVSHEFNQRNCW
ncbi:rIIB protein [Aeromonas phage ZPAH1]|nr:rIIB protein [Aeromonas phage ZPAH1]